MNIKRKPVVLGDIKPNAGIHAHYRAELNRLLRSVRNDVMALVKSHKHEIAMDSPTLPQLIDDLMVYWLKRLMELPQVMAREFVTSTASTYDRRFAAALRKNGFTVNLQMTDYTRAAMKAAVGQNVGLIKSIPTEYLADVSKLVWSAVEGGFDLKTLTDNLDHAYHVGRNRCKLIALDQSRKVHAVMEQARRKELGIKRAIWRHSSAAKVPRASHVAANGKVFDIDKGLYLDGEYVLPGQLINCHPGNETLSLSQGVNHLWRRRYTGKLSFIVSDDGTVLNATPNHPILTNRGWIAIKDINEGDYVIKRSPHGLDTVKGEVKANNPTFAQAFDAASFFISPNRASADGAVFKFHGDVADQNVDTINFDGVLPDVINAGAVKEFFEFLLAEADHLLIGVSSVVFDAKFNAFSALFSAPRGIVRSSHLLLSFLKGEFRHLDGSVFTDASLFNQMVVKARSNCSSATIEALGEFELANPTLVKGNDFISRQIVAILSRGLWDGVAGFPDFAAKSVAVDPYSRGCLLDGLPLHEHEAKRVVEVGFRYYDGHVYNLSNELNWYEVSNLVSHNCGCTSRAIIDF